MRTVVALLLAVAACSDPAEPDTFDGYGEWTQVLAWGACSGRNLAGHNRVTISDGAVSWSDGASAIVHRGEADGPCFTVDGGEPGLEPYSFCPMDDGTFTATLTWDRGLAGECETTAWLVPVAQ